MTEPTHKIVNGVRVDLTQEEVNSIKEAWRIEDEKRAQRQLKKEQDKLTRQNARNKLISLGLTEEEISLLGIKK